MPRVPDLIQEPMALYPVVAGLDQSGGLLQATLADIPSVDPSSRITLVRLAGLYGRNLGPTDGADQGSDIILEVEEEDFKRAEPRAIEQGLYIPRHDSRYRDPATEQLVRITPEHNKMQLGVVFPVNEFHVVARSAPDLAKHVMAKTRRANAGNPDHLAVESTVGRSAAHALDTKIQGLNKLENELIENRNSLLIPLYRDTRRIWQSHFKAKNLDKKFKQFQEQYHQTIETACINLGYGTTTVKALHRAALSRQSRRGTTHERNQRLQEDIVLLGRYTTARRAKIVISKNQCEQELAYYEPFLNLRLDSSFKTAPPLTA